MPRILTPEKCVSEKGRWHASWWIQRFEDDTAYQAFKTAVRKRAREIRMLLNDPLRTELENEIALRGKFAYSVTEFAGNALENAGINLLWQLVGGTGGTKFNEAAAYLAVGDGTDEFDAADTDLQGSNKTRAAMEAGFPSYGTAQKITYKSSFGGAVANHAWQEHAVTNAASGPTILNRKLSDQGTKTAGQTWVESLEVSLS